MLDVHVFVVTVDDDQTYDTQTRSISNKRGRLFRKFFQSRGISCVRVGPEHACSCMVASMFEFQQDAEVMPILAARSLKDAGNGAEGALLDFLQSLPDKSVVIAQAQFLNCLRCDCFPPDQVRSRSLYQISLRAGEIHDIVELDMSKIIPSEVAEEAGEAPVRHN